MDIKVNGQTLTERQLSVFAEELSTKIVQKNSKAVMKRNVALTSLDLAKTVLFAILVFKFMPQLFLLFPALQGIEVLELMNK